jgi:fibronectin type 3 domain-containing protein
VPGFAEGAAGGSDARRPAIDLSWEPDMEARVAGYSVYRRTGDAGAWERLGDGLVKAPAYRDAAVAAGQRYVYRVTAVSEAGMESRASGEVEETAPGR